MNTKATKDWPTDEQFERERIAEALSFAPEIYRCKKCGHAVVRGYACRYCGDMNPSDSEDNND